MVNFAVTGPVWLERRKRYVIKPGFPNANATWRGVFGILEYVIKWLNSGAPELGV